MTADRTLNSHAVLLAPTATSVPPSGPTPLRLTPCAPPYAPHPVPDRAAAACGRTAVTARFPHRMRTQATTGLQSARSSRPALALRMTSARARDSAQDRPILMKTSCARATPVASRCVPLASAMHARLCPPPRQPIAHPLILYAPAYAPRPERPGLVQLLRAAGLDLHDRGDIA